MATVRSDILFMVRLYVVTNITIYQEIDVGFISLQNVNVAHTVAHLGVVCFTLSLNRI